MDDNNDNSEIEIDQNDLIIIRDTQNWKPSKEYIVAYASQLGFDVDNDPPELLSIAEKYLTKDIPDYFLRAFHKNTLQILYINVLTNEIELSSEYEDLAKKEYKELKEKYYKEIKSKEILANSKVTVVPRKKIAPIGTKKLQEDPKKKKEQEFMKKIEKTFKESMKENQYEDEETRKLKATIKKGEEKANLFFNDNNNENIQDKYRNSDDEEIENKYDDDIDYDKKHEINSRERKFPSKNQIKNSNNQRNDINNLNNLNNNDDNKGNLKLILTDSNDNNNDNLKDKINQYKEDTYSDEEQEYNDQILSKNNNNNKQNFNEENNDNEQNFNNRYNNNINYSNQNNEINIINNQNSLKADNDEDRSPRIQRSNVRHKNISKNYRYDQKKIEEINNEVNNRKESDGNNNAYNNNNNSNSNNNNNISIKINEVNEDSVDYDEQKKKYLNQTKQKLKNYKKGLFDSFVKKKKNFVDNYINNLSSEKSKDLRKKLNKEKEEISEKLSEFEKELKNIMKKETEKYKQKLVSEYEDNLYDNNNNTLTEGDFDDIKKKLELTKMQKESEIRIQKNKNSKLSQNKINNKNLKLDNLRKELKNKKSQINAQTEDEINKMTKKYEKDFNSYSYEFTLKNEKKNNSNYNNKEIQEELNKYQQQLTSNLEEKKKAIQKEYENKFFLEIENFKNTAKLENTNSYSEDNEKIEEEYYNDINDLKMRNKESNNRLNEKIQNILEKASNLSEQIKIKELKEINSLFSQLKQQINKINQEENNNNDYLIDDYISELYSNKKIYLNKYSSQVDMTEDEYKKMEIFLQYYIDIIKSIINLLYGVNSKHDINIPVNKNVNEDIIKEIEKNISLIIEKYRNKYINEKNNRLYEFLYNSLKKLMDSIFSDENTNNIIENSIYGRSFFNNNLNNISQSMSNTNYLNNSVSSGFNSNNKLRSARILQNNNNLINNSNLNDISNNDSSSGHIFFNTQRQRQNQNQNPNQRVLSSSISPDKGNPHPKVLNKTFSNSFAHRYNNFNNMQSIHEEVEPSTNRIDLDDINVPQLPSDIVNNLTAENLSSYKIIIDFLVEESQNFIREQNLYYQKMNENNKLNILSQNGELSQYQGVFDIICKKENNNMNQYLKDIQTKSNIFEIIKKNCEENFNFIMKYYNRPNFVSNKLRVLVTHIQDYHKNFYSTKAQNENIFSKNNVEHLLNNTFSINRSNNFNNTQNMFNNTMNYGLRNNII